MLGNCTSCGYILCDKERSTEELGGYVAKCPFCKANVLKSMSADEIEMWGCDEETMKAYRHKVIDLIVR